MILKKQYLWYLNFIFFLYPTITHSKYTFLDNDQKIFTIIEQRVHNIEQRVHKDIQEAIKSISKEDEFLNLIDQDNPTVVMAWMDNCPHCNTIKPVFNELAHDKKHKGIKFASVNGKALKIHKHVERETKDYDKPFKVAGYPSFIFIKNKKIADVLVGGNEEKLKQKIKQLKS